MAGTEDPTRPGYVPSYEGQDSRDLGGGTRFGGDLYDLYAAGQVYLPDVAGVYSAAASEIHYIQAQWSDISARLASFGAIKVGQELDRVFDALALNSKRLYDAGEALVVQADDFARTDDDAAGEFARLLRKNEAMFASPPPRRDPPRPEDPPTTTTPAPPDETSVEDLLADAGIEDELAERNEDSDQAGD